MRKLLLLAGALLFMPARVVAAADAVAAEQRIADPVFRGEVRLLTAGPPAAPPVVLIHGIGARAAGDWDGLIPELARDCRVLAFALPGFGRSSRRNEPYTPGNYAASGQPEDRRHHRGRHRRRSALATRPGRHHGVSGRFEDRRREPGAVQRKSAR